jgi:putative endonuclease
MTKSTVEKGKWGEKVTENFLIKKRYKIVFKNWRAEKGDIDIIALDGNCLVFVEVKSGSTEIFGPPELRITQRKKRQLYKLGLAFLQRADEYNLKNDSYRFDVVVVDGNQNKHEIRQYKNAIYF